MEMISCCDPVQDSASTPVSNNCREGIGEVQVTKETASFDSSTENPNVDASDFSKSSLVEDKDVQLMTCSSVETAQNLSTFHSEDDEQMISEDTKPPSRFVDFRQQIAVKSRTAIVTRLDGVDLSTGSDVSFYKCHLCGKLFGRLADVPMHLSMHSPQQLTLYRCLLCDGSFSFKTKLVQHLRMHHNVNLPRWGGNSGSANGVSLSSKDLLDPSSCAGSSDCGRKDISPQRHNELLRSGADIALRAASESPPGLEIDTLRNSEDSGMLSGSQFKLLHLSVEDSDTIPADEFVLGKLSLEKLSDGRKSLFRCDPVKGLTKTNSFLCQMCGFESWRQSRLLHHVIKHHLNLAAVQRMRKQILHRRKLPLQHQTSEGNMRRMSVNGRELRTVSSETGNCSTSSTAESRTVASAAQNVDCKEKPLSLSPTLKPANCVDSEPNGLDDGNALTVKSDPVFYDTNDMHDSPETNYSDVSESFHKTEKIETDTLLMTPVSPMSAEQLKVMDNRAVSSLISKSTSNSISSMTPLQPDATIPTSSSMMTMSSLIEAHENASECKPLVFNPNSISPLLHGFLPLPLLSLFVSQSALNSAPFLGAGNSNTSQFSSDQVKVPQQGFNEQFSATCASNSWDDASKEEDIKPNRAVLDWGVMVQNQMRSLASRGPSTLSDQ